MSQWIKVAELAVLRRRKRLKVTIGELQIALFCLGDEVFALNDICIHKGSSLSQGVIFKGKVICPGHQWAFDIRTGWVDEWARCQPVFPVKLEEQAVYVKAEPKGLRGSFGACPYLEQDGS